MANYTRPDATLPAIAENGGRADMSSTEIGQGWSTTSQTRPPADRFNTRDFITSSAVKYICRLGVAEYSPSESYQGLGMCIGSDGSIYWNLMPSTGINPVGDTTGHWERMPCRVHDAQSLINSMISILGFLTYALADARYMQLGTAPTWDQVNAAFATFAWVQANFATFQWVWDQLGNYATNASAQAWANNAQNNATEYTDWRLNEDLPWLQGQIDSINGQIANINNRLAGHDSYLGSLDGRIGALMPTGSIDGNGWVQFPNGLIQQWAAGAAQNATGTLYQTVYFPRQFPNTCLNCQVSTQWASSADNQIFIWQSNGWTRDYCAVRRARRGDDGAANTTPYVFATGY